VASPCVWRQLVHSVPARIFEVKDTYSPTGHDARSTRSDKSEMRPGTAPHVVAYRGEPGRAQLSGSKADGFEARPHPDPLPQVRERRFGAPGTFTKRLAQFRRGNSLPITTKGGLERDFVSFNEIVTAKERL